MKKKTIMFWQHLAILITFSFVVIFGVYFLTRTAHSKDQQQGMLKLDLETTRAVVNVHHVGMSSTVNKSDCRACLDWYTLDECKTKELCLDVDYN